MKIPNHLIPVVLFCLKNIVHAPSANIVVDMTHFCLVAAHSSPHHAHAHHKTMFCVADEKSAAGLWHGSW
jgi:hypothetical protein